MDSTVNPIDAYVNPVPDSLYQGRHFFLVGPGASRERIKESLFELYSVTENQGPNETAPVLWSDQVLGVQSFFREVWKRHRRLQGRRENTGLPKRQTAALRFVDRVDVLATLAKRGRLGEKRNHSRKQLEKMALFLSAADGFVLNKDDLDLLADVFSVSHPRDGRILNALSQLWAVGEMESFSEAYYLREFLKMDPTFLRSAFGGHSFTVLGWEPFSPLEGAALEYGRRCGLIQQEKAVTPESLPEYRRVWCHSFLDELDCAAQQFLDWNQEGVAFNEMAIVLESAHWRADEFTLLHEIFSNRGVPLREAPASYKGAEEKYDQFWSQSFEFMVQGLRFQRVPGFPLSASDAHRVREQALLGGFRQVQSLSQQEVLSHSWIQWMGRLAPRWAKRLSIQQFYDEAVSSQIPSWEPEYGASELLRCLESFCLHLLSRPYLGQEGPESFRARLPEYYKLWQEYLKYARTGGATWIHPEGIQCVRRHEVLLRSFRRVCQLRMGHFSETTKATAPHSLQFDDSLRWHQQRLSKVWSSLNFRDRPEMGQPWSQDLFESGLKGLAEQAILMGSTHQIDGQQLREPEFLSALGGSTERGQEQVYVASKIWSRFSRASTGVDHELYLPGFLEAFKDPCKRKVISFEIGNVSISFSAFEDYLRCPRLFYFRHIRNLRIPDEASPEGSPLSRGKILHSVLESMMREQIQKGRSFGEKEGKERLDQLLSKALHDTREGCGLLPSKILRQSFFEDIKQRLFKWWEHEGERKVQFPEIRPLDVEVPVEISLNPSGGSEVGALVLRGRMDRVDQSDSCLVLMDYKTGKSPFLGKDILEGKGCQLLGYSLAAQRRWELPVAGAWYLALGRKVDDRSGFFLNSFQGHAFRVHSRNSGLFRGPSEDLFGKALEFWEERASSLVAGNFTAQPFKPAACQGCAYEEMCPGAGEFSGEQRGTSL